MWGRGLDESGSERHDDRHDSLGMETKQPRDTGRPQKLEKAPKQTPPWSLKKRATDS